MAVSTVADSRKHASATAAKSKSEFSIRSWFFGARKSEQADDEPFAPDAQSQWAVEQVRAELRKAVSFLTKPKHAAASPTDLDGSHPAYLLRRIGMQALDLEIDPELTFRGAADRLRWAWDLLEQRAAEEEAFERHVPVNAAEAAAHGALLFATGRRGESIGPESERGQVAVADVVDRAVKAAELTGRLPKITDDMTDPREVEPQPEPTPVEVTVVPALTGPSPVHVPGDGSHAPLPDPDDPAAHTLLPHRTPHATVIAAPVGPDGGPLHGKRLNPREVELGGAWVFYGGAGGSGPVYRLVASVQVREDDTLITYVCGDTQTVKRDAKSPTVRVLTSSEASDLLAQYEGEGASL